MGPKSRGWVLLLCHGTVLALGGVYALARGRALDRELYEAVVGPSWPVVVALVPAVERLVSAFVRFTGALAVACGVIVIALAMTSFRRGERWAWYAAWALPVHATIDLAVLLGYGALTPVSAAWDVTLLVLSTAALVSSASVANEAPLGQAAT